MSTHATIYFKSGRVRSHDAPRSIDTEGKYFGGAFPFVVEQLNQSARDLGVVEPKRFIWDELTDYEGDLDTITEEEINERMTNPPAPSLWIPIEQGIETFAALSTRYELNPEFGTPTERDQAIAFEVNCFLAALREAAAEGEEAFHIQCY